MTQFDKIAGKVGYNDAAHTYTHVDDGKRYTSVTTLIHNYVPEFKGDYWATYKACKDVMEQEGTWYAYKIQAGGWEDVVQHFESSYKINLSTKTIEAVLKRKQWYLDKWDADRDNSCILGSEIHNSLEDAAYVSQQIREGEANYEVTEENILNIQDFTGNGVYPELLMYSDTFMVAGQADKVFREGMDVDIHDYKTCKSIDMEGFRGETLLEPLTHLQNANYWIYCLQLSMYGYILEMMGFKVRNLYMHHIHGKNREDKKRNAGVKTYELPYMKEDVIRILELNKAA